LVDAAALDRIVQTAALESTDTVLEIGGGIGNLSERIAPRVCKLIIIELDPQMVAVLKDRLAVFPNIEIVSGDVMDVDLSAFRFNKVVANLPYSISSDVTLKLLRHPFDTAVLMYQYEFAQRLTASAGGKEYGRLSVHVQYKTDASFVFKVSKGAFEPAPKVDSAVVRLQQRPVSYSVKDESFFFDVTKVLFSQRRKKIKNTLLSGLSGSVPHLKEILDCLSEKSFDSAVFENQTVGDILSRRAEELPPADIAHLSNLIYEHISSPSQRG
jgi:16S rRNA (adenine1518-N6/adenine1519-N6)-dimethyltransferase